MKIGIDARFYGTLGKGLGRYTEKLITHLECLPDDSHTYIIFLRRENYREYTPRNSRFVKCLADFPWYSWQEQLLFPLLLWRQRLDLVHFPHFNVPLFLGLPFVVTIHDLILLHYPTVKATQLPPFLYWFKYRVYRKVIASAIRRAKAILTVSAFTRQDLEGSYPEVAGKITVTLEAAEAECHWVAPEDASRWLQGLGLTEAMTGLSAVKPFVLYVGNAYPHKNLPLLLKMAPLFPTITFLCVGREDYFYHSLRKRAETLGITNVRFVGHVDDSVLGVLYQHARAYLFPSLYEGFGLPGLEAMTYGTPVVAAQAGSLPEIYGEAALYFHPTEPLTCQKALEQVFQTTVRETLRQRGFQCAGQYSWQRMARETRCVYNKILGEDH